jgi:hypothetical protein
MAKNIHEIFKSNPDLLETTEVKELVKEFSNQFKSLQKQRHDYWNEVTDVLMRTDFYVINGLSSDEAIKLLIDKSF